MNDVSTIVSGLTGDGGILVLLSLVLCGIYFIAKQFMNRLADKLDKISEELVKTRETLIIMQQSDTHLAERVTRNENGIDKLETRVGTLEGKVK